MARNAVKKAAPAPAAVPGEVPPLKGGTLGSPATQARASALPAAMVGSGKRRVSEAPSGRRFEVVRSPGMVGYPGQGKVQLRVGKIVSDASCDLDHLRRQGVVLQELPPEPSPEPEEDEELIPVETKGEEQDPEKTGTDE